MTVSGSPRLFAMLTPKLHTQYPPLKYVPTDPLNRNGRDRTQSRDQPAPLHVVVARIALARFARVPLAEPGAPPVPKFRTAPPPEALAEPGAKASHDPVATVLHALVAPADGTSPRHNSKPEFRHRCGALRPPCLACGVDTTAEESRRRRSHIPDGRHRRHCAPATFACRP